MSSNESAKQGKRRLRFARANGTALADPNIGEAGGCFEPAREAVFGRRDGILDAENDGIPSNIPSRNSGRSRMLRDDRVWVIRQNLCYFNGLWPS